MFLKLKNLITRYFKKRKQIKNLRYASFVLCNVKTYGDFVFEEGHQIRPFFVLEVNKEIVCIPCTHHKRKDFFMIKVPNYDSSIFTNKGIFKLNKKLFIKDITSNQLLNKEEISFISKRLYTQFKDTEYKHLFLENIILKVNDVVIKDDEHYLITYIDTLNNLLHCYKYSRDKDDENIKVSEAFYIYPKVIKLDPKSVMYQRTNKHDKTLEIKEAIKINKIEKKKSKEEYEKLQKVQKKLQSLSPGDLVMYMHDYYMILNTKPPYQAINYYTMEKVILENLEDLKYTSRQLSKNEITFLMNFAK